VCIVLLQPLDFIILDHNRTVEKEEEGGSASGFGRRLLEASTQAQAMRSQYVFWLDKQNTIWYLL
jgi:hypothetical protein